MAVPTNVPLVEGARIAARWYQSRLGRLRRGQKIALWLAVLVFGAFVVWNLILFPTYTYRYRMTVNVETGGKRYSGASVIEVRLKRQPEILQPRVAPEVTGEAVFVDLGGGRNVIALLTQWQDTDYPTHLIDKHFRLSYADEDLAKFPRLKERWQLANDELPTFLTFTDLNDAASARVVPAGGEGFAEELGQGTRLLNVIVETTKAPITVGIEKKLLWWNKPFPWLQPRGGGVSFDTRREGLRWDKFMLKRD